MKLDNLSHKVTAPSSYPRGMVTFSPDLWNTLAEYRERREQSGLVRLGVRVVLGLVSDDNTQLESAADHLVISCASDEDALELAWQCERLGKLVREQTYKRMRE